MKAVPLCLALALSACSSLDPSVGAAADADAVPCGDIAPDGVCFARDIRPIILRTRDEALAMGTGRGCFPCHNGNAATHTGTSLSGFDLSTLGELRKGGGSTGTRIIVPGKPNESGIVQALRGQYMYAPRMPKNGPFWTDDSEEMRLLTTWIAEGAKGKADE